MLGFFAHVKDGDNPGMYQPSGRLCLKKETFPVFAVLVAGLAKQGDGLKGYKAVDLGIARLVNHTHGSAAEFGHDLVPAQAFTFANGHRLPRRGILHVISASDT